MALARSSYHHGDLRNALIDAAALLAEQGGPEAVTVRAAARAVRVTPTAAYRHFAGHTELLGAVTGEAMASLGRSMRHDLGLMTEDAGPVQRAVHYMTGLGRGYVRFALEEPGLFRTAFCLGEPIQLAEQAGDPDHPFGMLSLGLDELVKVGFMAPEHRLFAEVAALSTVHGLATLLIDGPFAGLPEPARDLMVHRTLAACCRSLSDGPAAEPFRSTDPACTGAAPAPPLRFGGRDVRPAGAGHQHSHTTDRT